MVVFAKRGRTTLVLSVIAAVCRRAPTAMSASRLQAQSLAGVRPGNEGRRIVAAGPRRHLPSPWTRSTCREPQHVRRRSKQEAQMTFQQRTVRQTSSDADPPANDPVVTRTSESRVVEPAAASRSDRVYSETTVTPSGGELT